MQTNNSSSSSTRPPGAACDILSPGLRVPPASQEGPCVATWFGGDNDPDDNGETSSGVFTKGHPHILGCALPCRVSHATPNPKYKGLPFGTAVMVARVDGGSVVIVPLIDNGPSDRNPAHAKIDLTVGTFAALGIPVVNGRPVRGSVSVYFRISAGETFVAWDLYLANYRRG